MIDRISLHISFYEATRSETAIRRGIQNIPGEKELNAMRLTALMIFEPVRCHFNVPIRVNSFYRNPMVNRLVGGSATSQHMTGEAIDMDALDHTGLTNKDIFEWIKGNLEWDQLIWEYGNKEQPAWVHCSYKETGNRKQILYIGI